MNKKTGIWLDLRNAYIIHLPEIMDDDAHLEVEVQHLASGIEESAASGGARSKSPWGPQGGDMKRTAQERRHHEEKHFFETILQAIRPHTVELVIFGPSEAKHGLANVINDQTQFQPKLLGIKNADQMTQKQMVAWVREFFHHPAPRHLPPGRT